MIKKIILAQQINETKQDKYFCPEVLFWSVHLLLLINNLAVETASPQPLNLIRVILN